MSSRSLSFSWQRIQPLSTALNHHGLSSTYRISVSSTHPWNRKYLLSFVTDVQADRRLDLFSGGHYVDFNLTSALNRAMVSGGDHVRMTVWSAPGMSKPTFGEAKSNLRSSAKPYKVGDWLGKSWTNHWVHVDLTIPEKFLASEESIACG